MAQQFRALSCEGRNFFTIEHGDGSSNVEAETTASFLVVLNSQTEIAGLAVLARVINPYS